MIETLSDKLFNRFGGVIFRVKNWYTSQTDFMRFWLLFMPLSVTAIGIFTGDSFVNVLIGLIGATYVSVYTTGTRYNFLLGTVYVLLYMIICLQNKVYLDALQNVILVPMYLYSFYSWGKNNTKPHNLSTEQVRTVLICTVVLFFSLFGLSNLLGGNYSLLDALNTSCTLSAMFLGIYGASIAWWMWTINNVSSAIIFVLAAFTPTGSIAVAAMKIIFCLNSLIGYYNFSK